MKAPKIGFTAAVSIVIANMIGVGVFTSLGFQLNDLQDYRAILLIWILGGILALLGSFCYAELSSTFPKSGGEYHFLRISFGNHTGFLSGWTSAIVGFAAPIAAAAHAFAKYFTNVIHLDMNPLYISASLIICITLIHSFSVKVGSRFQVYFTIGKVTLMCIFIIAGFLISDNALPVVSENGPALITSDLLGQLQSKGFWIGLIFVSYAYSGWNASAYMVEDIKDPSKNVPRSILLGTIVVAILYTLINYVFLRAAPADILKNKTDVAHEAAKYLFGSKGAVIISSLISFFLISTISSMIIVGPRVIKRISEDYDSFKFFAKETDKNVPLRSLMLQSSIALLILFTSSFDSIITSVGFILTVFTTLTAISVIIMRYKEPFKLRPLKTPFYPFAPLLYCIFNIWILYFTIVNKPFDVLTGLGFLLIGSLFYLLISRRQTLKKIIPIILLISIFSCNQSHDINTDTDLVADSAKQASTIQEKLPAIDTLLETRASILAGMKNGQLDQGTAITSASLDSNWQRSYRQILLPVRTWTSLEGLDSLRTDSYGVFYPFSGPDMAYAQQFYPEARIYILAGLEPAGNNSSILFSDQPDYSSFIKNADRYFYFSNRLGFFRTDDMARQFAEKGVVDILAFYLKKNQCKIVSADLKKWDPVLGDVVSIQTNEKADICHVTFITPGQILSEMYYFSKDLSDDKLKTDSLWLNWVKSKFNHIKMATLTKSASYLMGKPRFSEIRNFILQHSILHIQDDSGIDFEYIKSSKRPYKLYGKYTRTIPLFSNNFNKDMATHYLSDSATSLPFKIGYNIIYGESNLQVIY